MKRIHQYVVCTARRVFFALAVLMVMNFSIRLRGQDNVLTNAEGADGWKSLFDGKGFGGWKGSAEVWSIDHGAITATNKTEHHALENRPLIWKEFRVSDFEVTYKAKALPVTRGQPLTCWFVFRGDLSPAGDDVNARFGEQDVFNNPYSGSLSWHPWGKKFRVADTSDPGKPSYQEDGQMGDEAEMREIFKVDDWNDYKVVAIGNHIQFFVNGKEVCEVTDERKHYPKIGYLALKMYFWSTPGVIQFKDLKLKKLGSSLSQLATTTGNPGQLKILSEQFATAKEWALARLDLAVPGTIADRLNALKVSLTAESALNRQDMGAQDCYKMGIGLCDSLSAALKFREQAFQQAGGTVIQKPGSAGILQWDQTAKSYGDQLGAYYTKFVAALTARGTRPFAVSPNAPEIIFPTFVAPPMVK